MISHVYSQGVNNDGTVILCDGLPISVDKVVALLNHSDRMRLSMQVFVDRCKAGEVRSVRTHAAFDNILSAAPNPHDTTIAVNVNG